MKKYLPFLLSACCLLPMSFGPVSGDSSSELKLVPELDLNKYAGLWYEIARLPNRFQRKCAADVTARYQLLDDGTISVINACVESDGTKKTAKGVARLANKEGPTSKLEVRFAPSFLSFLPFVWGDYWVIDLAPDYSYSVVGNPDRSYLWILSRTPKIEESAYAKIVGNLEMQGYDTSELMITPQRGGR